MARTERPRSVVAFEDADREHPHVDTWIGAPIDDERIRALALAAPYLEYWESHHDELVFRRTEGDDTPREVCIDTLRDWWSVTGHDETLDTVGRLLAGMHAPSYEVVHPLVTELLDTEDAPSAGAGSLRNRHRGFLVEAARSTATTRATSPTPTRRGRRPSASGSPSTWVGRCPPRSARGISVAPCW